MLASSILVLISSTGIFNHSFELITNRESKVDKAKVRLQMAILIIVDLHKQIQMRDKLKS